MRNRIVFRFNLYNFEIEIRRHKSLVTSKMSFSVLKIIYFIYADFPTIWAAERTRDDVLSKSLCNWFMSSSWFLTFIRIMVKWSTVMIYKVNMHKRTSTSLYVSLYNYITSLNYLFFQNSVSFFSFLKKSFFISQIIFLRL